MECPKCGSTNCKKLSIIVDEGTYTGVSYSDGTIKGSSRGTVGGKVQSSSISGTVSSTIVTSNKSALAYKLAPPYRSSPANTVLWGIGYSFGGLLIIQLICSGIFGRTSDGFPIGGLVGFTIGISITAFIMKSHLKTAIEEHRFNKDEYPDLYHRWERSFHCNRCGEVFEERG